MFVVVVTEKGGSQQRLKFDKEEVLIGRVHGNDVVLPRGNVSKQHSKLAFKDGEFSVSDMESTNGTYVNGRRIFSPQSVTSKDKVYVGDFILHVEYGDALPPEIPRTSDDTDKNPILDTSDSPPMVVSKTAQKPPSRTSRPSVPPPAPRISEAPSEKRVPLPRPSLAAGEPPSRKRRATRPPPRIQTASATAETDDATVHSLRKQVVNQLNLPAGDGSAVKMDLMSTAQVRTAVGAAVDALYSGGDGKAIPSPGALKGKVFRQIVDHGPLGDWLENRDITGIRIDGLRSVSFAREGKWTREETGIENAEALKRVIETLSAGIDRVDASVQKTRKFLTDEGYAVYAVMRQDGPVVLIDKTVALGLEVGISSLIGESGLAIIQGVIDSDAKIAILGKSPSARQLVFYHLLRLLPETAFTIALEPLPMPLPKHPNRLQLPFTLNHALSLEPDWLAIGGAVAEDTPPILGAAAGRLGLLVDMPLGGVGPLDRELATVMTSAGVSLSPSEAAILMDASFDTAIIADRSRSGEIYIKRILACGLSDTGSWAPSVLFSVEQTR